MLILCFVFIISILSLITNHQLNYSASKVQSVNNIKYSRGKRPFAFKACSQITGFETNTGSFGLFNKVMERNQNQTEVRKSALILHSITSQKIVFYRLTANKIITNTPWEKNKHPLKSENLSLKVGVTSSQRQVQNSGSFPSLSTVSKSCT